MILSTLCEARGGKEDGRRRRGRLALVLHLGTRNKRGLVGERALEAVACLLPAVQEDTKQIMIVVLLHCLCNQKDIETADTHSSKPYNCVWTDRELFNTHSFPDAGWALLSQSRM